MKVTYPWDEIPAKDRHHWGLAILAVKEFSGRVLYDKFCDLVEGGLNGTPFLCWAALTDTTHLAWGRAAAAGGAHVLNHRRVDAEFRAKDLPPLRDNPNGPAPRIMKDFRGQFPGSDFPDPDPR